MKKYSCFYLFSSFIIMTSVEIKMGVFNFILNPCSYAARVVMKLWDNIFIPL